MSSRELSEWAALDLVETEERQRKLEAEQRARQPQG